MMRFFPYRTFLLSCPPHEAINQLAGFIRPEGQRSEKEERWYVGTVSENNFKIRRDYVKSGYYKERIPGNGDSFSVVNGRVESHLNGSRVLLEIVPGKWAYRAIITIYLFATAFGLWWGFSFLDFLKIIMFLFLPFALLVYLFHVVSGLYEMKIIGRDMQAFFAADILQEKDADVQKLVKRRDQNTSGDHRGNRNHGPVEDSKYEVVK